MPNDGIPTNEELTGFIDGTGQRAGTAGNPVARDAPAIPRKTVSVFLFDGEGRMLLQRRAASKFYSPGAWSSSCDGHARPGEAPEMEATSRLAEELDVIPRDLTRAGAAVYWQTDPVLGLGECVVNHVFAGRLLTPPCPDPAEVAEVAMVTPAELHRMLAGEQFSSWFRAVTEVALIRIPAWLAGLADWSEDVIGGTADGR
ncbi:MAG TPA: NUDIX domain-containing protein [Streptosporangiaceae bacterium]|jgi:isopentenyl-diphosphate delta-isomerase